MTTQSLALYYYEGCPYCQRVLQYLKESQTSIEKRNVNQTPEYRDILIQQGGKAQVPALQINDQILYESLDIIEWLKNRSKT